MAYWGGIEAGGTKFVCGVCTEDGHVVHRQVILTTSPENTMPQVSDYFQRLGGNFPLEGIGLASFGPVNLNLQSQQYGSITSTPKAGWQYFAIKQELETLLGRQVAFDTDVNAAVWGESIWGAAVGLENAAYLTVGTGIGGGLLVNGALVHGLVHSEIGHIHIDNPDQDFRGVCPFHENCLEGVASGPAIETRWGVPGHDLPPDHPAWDLEAGFLAEGITNLILTLSPEKVILGGGVMAQTQLFPKIRAAVAELLNGYLRHPAILENMDEYIIPPALGADVGLLGAAALAMPQAESHGDERI